MLRFLCIFLLFLAAAPPVSAAAFAPAPEIAPGTTEKVVVDERVRCCRRSYRLHVPKDYAADESRPRPLLIALHGGLSTGKIFEEQTGFSEIADREDFLAVYPNGMGIGPALRHWNGGYCCAKAMKIDLDDIGFLDRVIEAIAATYVVDRARIYVVGYSNGGMLAYWYAAERADRLAGVGVWGTSIGERVSDDPEERWTWPRPVASLPTIVTHGLADPRLPWEASGERNAQRLLGAVGSAETWAEINDCDEEPVSRTGWDGNVEYRSWCGDGEAPVLLLGVEGWDHDWPGPKLNKRPSSDPLHEFDLAEEMWTFFAGLSSQADE